MKKLITLLAALLLGVGSIFAAPYEVKVSWSYDSPQYCLSQLSNEYEFKITLIIIDQVNQPGEVANVTNTEVWTETETTFSALQTGVEDWCDTAPNTPSFRVSVLVEMVHKTTQSVYCYESASGTYSCNDFSAGTIEFELVFN